MNDHLFDNIESESPSRKDSFQAYHQDLMDVLDRISDGFFAVDRQWRITFLNHWLETKLAIRRADVLYHNLWSCYPSLCGTIYDEQFHRALQENVTVNFEQYSPRYNSWFEITAYPYGTGLSVFFRDNTERKRVQDALELSNERFHLAAKTDAIYDWDLVSNHLHWGEGLGDVFGYTSDELQMNQWAASLHPADKQALEEDLYQTLDNPAATMWKYEYRIRRKDGEYCYVFERGYIIRDGNGKAVRMVGVMQNITERKATEEELRRLSLIAKETVNGVFVTDLNHRIIWINDAFTKLTGYTINDAQGKLASELLDSAEADPKTLAQMSELAFKGKSFHVEVLNRTKWGGTIWCESSYQPVFNKAGEIIQYFCIITDISERKKLERELAQQQRMTTTAMIKGQERERTQIGRELHDNVNQVLTTVKLYQELILTGVEQQEDLVRQSMQLLQQAIDEIRGLSKRLSAPTLGSIKLADSVRELVDSVRVTGQFTVDIDTTAITHLDTSEELHLAIYRILQEQLTNILKHAEANHVKVQFDIVDGNLVLSLTDNGRGFDPQQKRHGIGVTNMRMRAESLNGTLLLHSVPDQGCVLVVTIPLPA